MLNSKGRLVATILTALVAFVLQPIASAQAAVAFSDKPAAAASDRPNDRAGETRKPSGPPESDPSEEAAIQAQINQVYQGFYNSYRLGAGDVIGIYVDKHPQDSVEKVAVSPVGQVYHPLLGNVVVAGKTLRQIQDYFTTSIAEFIRDPRVTIALLEANSARIGVLGDVRDPGVKLMTRPMRVLDAVTMAGGILDTGSSSDVSILRQFEDGRVQTLKANVKNILKGKSNPEDNFYLRAGDTIIVHGNLFKKFGQIASLVGVTSFVSFVTRGGR